MYAESSINEPLPSSKTLTFKMRPSAQPFLWKWVLFAWDWKIISISKAEHLTSFLYRGPGELGNGLLIFPWRILFLLIFFAQFVCLGCTKKSLSFLFINALSVYENLNGTESRTCTSLSTRLMNVAVADPAEGPGGGNRPLLFFETAPPPFVSGSRWPSPHPPYLKVWIRHCVVNP